MLNEQKKGKKNMERNGRTCAKNGKGKKGIARTLESTGTGR
jgi:hypothetical protein